MSKVEREYVYWLGTKFILHINKLYPIIMADQIDKDDKQERRHPSWFVKIQGDRLISTNGIHVGDAKELKRELPVPSSKATDKTRTTDTASPRSGES